MSRLKIPGLVLVGVGCFVPIYAVFDLTLYEQAELQEKRIVEERVERNSSVAMERAQSCSLLVEESTGFFLQTLTYVTEAPPGLYEGAKVCAMDGSTKSVYDFNGNLELWQPVSVDAKDLPGYYQLLVQRGLLSSDQVPSFFAKEKAE